MNIKEQLEQLEQWIERASNDSVENWFKENGWVPTEGKVIPALAAYKSGANFLLPLLEKALEQHNHILDLYWDGVVPKHVTEDLKNELLELLEKR